MIQTTVHGTGESPAIKRRVYYIGTDTLYEGYALCYNFDVADEMAETGTLSLADSLVPTAARRLQVEKPTMFNMTHFAGVVSEKSDGVAGPGWVEINLPGSICNIYAAANCDHEGTATIASGQIITITNQLYSFKYTGLPGTGSAVVLGDVNRSSTNGLVQAELMTGQPSGGVQEIWNQGTAGTVGEEMIGATATSLGGSVYLIPYGTIVVNLSAVAAALTSSLTGMLNSVGGNIPIGSKRVIKAAQAGATTATLGILCSLTRRLVGSVPVMSLGHISGTFGIASAASDCATFEWNGQSWTLTANANSLNLYVT